MDRDNVHDDDVHDDVGDDGDDDNYHLQAILWTKTSSTTGIRPPASGFCSDPSPWFDLDLNLTLVG